MSVQVLRAPRILYLVDDAATMRRQFEGARLIRASAGALRDEVSTDEITPVPKLAYFDERLGDWAHIGTQAGGQSVFTRGLLRALGVRVLVAGRRYGKGSSREHSPLAEKLAGIQLIFAESFERIYRQNADHIGLLTSTNFALLEALERGEPIYVDDVLAERDAQTQAILRAGGLLTYRQPQPLSVTVRTGPNAGRTLFEKIIARHLVHGDASLPIGAGLWVRPDLRFIHDVYTAMAAHMLESTYGADLSLHDVPSILAFEDHYSYTARSPAHVQGGLIPQLQALSKAHRAFVERHGIRHHGYLDPESRERGSEGISHALMAERYAEPGQLIVGTDSHTPHAGALGCVAYGVGTTDMANAFVTGLARLRMPPTMAIELIGPLPEGLTAKDVMLHLLAHPDIRQGAAVGKAVEFRGDVVRAFSIDERATLTNMTAELGGFTGLVAPDEKTVEFLSERRGKTVTLASWLKSDDDATFDSVLTLDCRALTPMVAAPGDPGRGQPLNTLQPPPRVDIAYGGSCTAGKREDFDHYYRVAQWAAARGLRKAEHVKFYLQFGTVDVRDYCIARGYLPAFEAIGAEILAPACGACANCGPGVSERSEQVTVSASNRNFPGRSGPGNVWLASPPTVVASAIAGYLCSFEQLKAQSGA